MRKLILLLTLLVGLPACAGTIHPPYREIAGSSRQSYSGVSFDDVWQDAQDTCAALEIRIRDAEAGRIRSRKLPGERSDGRLFVVLTPGEDAVTVYSYVEVRVEFDFEEDEDAFFDNVLGVGPESELEDLEDDLDRGKITPHEYMAESSDLEAEIDERDDRRRAAHQAADRVLIHRLAEWSHRFQATLKARINQRLREGTK